MPAITISTTPTLIAKYNPDRIDIVIMNSSSTPCYIGPDSNITPLNTIYLNQNDVYVDDYSGIKGYRGNIYGVTSTGTTTILYWERSQ